MASQALVTHLEPLLVDAENLCFAAGHLPNGLQDRQLCVEAMNRAAVIACVSAWEAYVEELVRECLTALRPPTPPMGLWPAFNASVKGQLGRFNTPNAENVRMLLSDALGFSNVQASWIWSNYTSDQAVQRLSAILTLRHQIAHGINPRPVVSSTSASQFIDFFRRLSGCTDRAVRDHLVNVLGIAQPWPP